MTPYLHSLLPLAEANLEATGVVFVLAGKLNSAELYAAPALFRQQWPRTCDPDLARVDGERTASVLTFSMQFCEQTTMKLLRTEFCLTLFGLCIFPSLPAAAKLGETVPQLTKKFGYPYETTAMDVGRTAYSFHERGCDIDVVVEGGRSVQETYYSFRPLQPNGEPPTDIVRSILQTNVPGAKWKDVEREGRKEEAAFATTNGKYIAGTRRADILSTSPFGMAKRPS